MHAATSSNLTATHSLISAEQRQARWDCRPCTVWLTGLSGSGKSTLAYGLEQALFQRQLPCLVLDGDNVRIGLNRDLDFSEAARRENIRRVAEVARLANEAGMLVIVSFISPQLADRALARQIIGAERFVEVYLATPLDVCEQRDPKGLYRKARAREISHFTGISAPYEAPPAPALSLDTSNLPAERCVQRLLGSLAPFLPPSQQAA